MKTRLAQAILMLSFLSIATIALPEQAHAQMTVKRSAGPAKRSVGPTRRTDSLSDRARGRDDSISARRDSQESSIRDRDDFDRDDAREDAVRRVGSSDETDDDSNEVVDDEHRTLGRACIYGGRGEVLYRPPGSRCRGDATPDAKTERPSKQAERQERQKRQERRERQESKPAAPR